MENVTIDAQIKKHNINTRNIEKIETEQYIKIRKSCNSTAIIE